MTKTYGHFIGGKHVAGTSGAFGDVFWPMTGEVAARVALANAADVNTAVENARAAQPTWAATNPQRRARVLMRFLDLANREIDSLTDLLARADEALYRAKDGGRNQVVALPLEREYPATQQVLPLEQVG